MKKTTFFILFLILICPISSTGLAQVIGVVDEENYNISYQISSLNASPGEILKINGTIKAKRNIEEITFGFKSSGIDIPLINYYNLSVGDVRVFEISFHLPYDFKIGEKYVLEGTGALGGERLELHIVEADILKKVYFYYISFVETLLSSLPLIVLIVIIFLIFYALAGGRGIR